VAAALQNELKPVGTLQRGSRGGQVTSLQKALNLITGASLVEDGDFGNSTHAAVVAFQKFFKLGADGVVGPKTKAMILLCLENIKNGK
jgi:peptidoglycan hydrolase-like protein with peptidoglycan-binding domain